MKHKLKFISKEEQIKRKIALLKDLDSNIKYIRDNENNLYSLNPNKPVETEKNVDPTDHAIKRKNK